MHLRVRAALAATAVATATTVLLGDAVSSPAAATAAAQTSAHVAVIPGFHAPVYPGTNGLVAFPSDSSTLSAYQFSEVGVGAVTTAALQSYDTIILYGQRWNALSSTAQAAINGFARTGKVVIWDADSTGSQDYGSFVHPFSTLASGEDGVKSGSVVTFPSGTNPLASSDQARPLFLD